MNWPPIILYFPLLLALAWAVAEDLRARRIPNALTALLLASGLVQAVSPYAATPLPQALLGILAGLGLMLPLFVLRALGGGDVKLLAAAGAWLGPGPTLVVFMLAAIVGMVMVVVQSLAAGRLRLLLRNSVVLSLNLAHVRQLGLEHTAATGAECRSVDKPLPYALPIFLATAGLVIGKAWLS